MRRMIARVFLSLQRVVAGGSEIGRWIRAGLVLAVLTMLSGGAVRTGRAAAPPTVEWWSSTEDLSRKLAPEPKVAFGVAPASRRPLIQLGASAGEPSIYGLGSSLEHSSCYNLSRLSPERREAVLRSLLHPAEGIGMSLMRICIGTPDFTASPWYTYNDLPSGQTDPELKQFSIDRDREYVLPILKQARQIQPELKLVASPWSPPAWMKTNGRIGGGRIDRARFKPLAEYFVRFLEAYRNEGLPVQAITLQNEPEYAPDTYPTCQWTAEEQRDFIRDHLGPRLKARGLDTLVWCYDHNFDHPEFPATILRDPDAARYVDGTAFHHYVGKPDAMSAHARAFPGKHVYFTEGSTFGPAGAAQIISYLEHGARSYNAWVVFIDQHRKPNPGPHPCSLTPVVLNPERREAEYRFDYFMYGHFTKFIRPGALRLATSKIGAAPPHVAYRQTDDSLVVVMANPDPQSRETDLAWDGRHVTLSLRPKSVATLRWRAIAQAP